MQYQTFLISFFREINDNRKNYRGKIQSKSLKKQYFNAKKTYDLNQKYL